MQARTRRLALTEGITAGALFGVASIFIRLLQGVDTFTIAFWRLAIACVDLLAIILVLGKTFNLDLFKKNVKELLVLGFFLSLHFIFFILAVKDTTILNATVLVNTTPIFSMFVSGLVFKLKPSAAAGLGLAVSFIGVSVIAYAETAMANPSQGFSPSLKGDLEAVAAALVEAFYLNYGRKIRNQMNILSIMLPIYAFTALFVAVFSFPARNLISIVPIQAETLLPLLGLGLLPTAVAHTLYFSSLSNLKSFETATLALIEPVGATILGMALFQEVPTPIFVLGVALVLTGILFVGRSTS